VIEMVEKTFFAPAERVSADVIADEQSSVGAIANIREFLDAQPSIAGIINRQRQFVLVNEQLLDALGMADIEEVLGKRPGEALRCIHSDELEGGCGTSESCRYCGAVQAILESQRTNSKIARECSVTCAGSDGWSALDLRVTASPCVLNDRDYTILAMSDIGVEKRRDALERVFFHDVINTATAMHLLIEELESGEIEATDELPVLKRLNGSLLDDVIAQRDLGAAERGELMVMVAPLDAFEVLRDVALQLGGANAGEGKRIRIDPASARLTIYSVERLLRRTLFNMLKNALEAVPGSSEIHAGVAQVDGGVRYWVRNETFMPPEVQANIFQRSFSTKGEGRGLGTYSMKLLGERYLQGKVSFESTEEGGTVFTAEFPLSIGSSDV
jgi:PAS domain-containing protein